MWHLLVRVEQDLLSDQLGGDLPFHLIGDLVARIVLRSQRQMRDHPFHESFRSISLKSRDERLLGERRQVAIRLGRLLPPLPGDQIGLVEGQDHSGVIPQKLSQLPVVAGRGHRQIHQKQSHIRIGDGPPHRLHHPLIQPMMRPGQARSIHENNLSLGRGDDPQKPPPGSLRLGRNYGHLLAHVPVDKGGFSHVGTTHHSDEARPEFLGGLFDELIHISRLRLPL